jgi:hypothetical protein
MKNHFLKHFVFGLLSLALGACVSVNIPTSAGSPAKDVKYVEPAEPFNDFKVKTADKAWISRKTGNTISFISDCHASVDPTLQQMENESLMVMDKLKVLTTQQIEFNGREAISTVAEGEVDGVPVKTQLVVLKKNNCNFTLSYGGLKNRFDTESKIFQTFPENFKAP